MNYLDVKQALYNSEEIANIPDQWDISLPFLCKLEERLYDTYACTLENDETQLMRLLMVDSITGRVRSMDAETAAETFGLDTLCCEAEPIGDYDRYLAGKDRYEELYDENHSQLIREKPIADTAAAEMLKLFAQTVGKVFLTKVVGKITDDFFALLSKAKQEQPVDIPEEPQEVELIENSSFPEE